MGVPVRLSTAIQVYVPEIDTNYGPVIDFDKLGDFLLVESAAIVAALTSAPAYVSSLGDANVRLRFPIVDTNLLKTPAEYNRFQYVFSAICDMTNILHPIVATGVSVTDPDPIPPSVSLPAAGWTTVTILTQLIAFITKYIPVTPQLTLFLQGVADFLFNMYPEV